MSLAETAVLAVELKLNGASQFKAGIGEADAATASLGKTTVATGSVFSQFGGKLGTAKQAIVSTGEAIGGMASHLKGVLTGPLGMIGLGAGLFTVAGILESSVKKLDDFSVGLEKVQALTGETVQQSSALILLYEKYGLGVDKVTQTIGFAEKTLGKLNVTMTAAGSNVTKLQAFDKQYGLQLVDNKGKVVDYSTLLSQLADVYDRNIPASTKAYIASQVLGRGYTTLIPVLKGGSAALREASAAAASLELNPKKVDAFREGMRNLGETVNVLQLRIGMALMPVLTDFVNLVNGWVAHGGSDQIVAFFKQGAVAARNFGQVMGDSVIPTLQGLGTAALAAWNTIPAPFRDWIVKGVVADRTIHFLFGVSPLHLAGSLIGDVAGPIIKTLIANRLIPQPVVIVGGGVPGLPTGGNLLSDAAAGVGGVSLASISAVTAAAAVSTWAFLQTYNGPKASAPGSFTPTIGSAFDNRPVQSSDFTGLGRAIVQSMGLDKSPGAAVSKRQTEPFTASAKEITAAANQLKAAAAAQIKTAGHILADASARDKADSAAIKAAILGAAKAIQARATTVLNTAARHDAETSSRVQTAIREMKPPSVAVAISIGGVALAQSVIHRSTRLRRTGPTGGTRQTSARQNEAFFP